MSSWATTIFEKVQSLEKSITIWMDEYTTPVNGTDPDSDSDSEEEEPLSAQETTILEGHGEYIPTQAAYCRRLRGLRTQAIRSDLRTDRDNGFDNVISKVRGLKDENTRMKAQLEAQCRVLKELEDEKRRGEVVIGHMSAHIVILEAEILALSKAVTGLQGLGGQDGALGLGVQLDGEWQVVVEDVEDEVEYESVVAEYGSDGSYDSECTLVEYYESE